VDGDCSRVDLGKERGFQDFACPIVVSRLLALARTRHIEFLDPVLLNEAEQSRGRGFQAPMGSSQMQPGFAVFFCELDGLEGASGGLSSQGEDDRAIRVADILLRALQVVFARCFPELATCRNGPRETAPSSGAPTAVRVAVLQGDFQSGDVCAGLAARDDAFEHGGFDTRKPLALGG
jgi:hypothetical protein